MTFWTQEKNKTGSAVWWPEVASWSFVAFPLHFRVSSEPQKKKAVVFAALERLLSPGGHHEETGHTAFISVKGGHPASSRPQRSQVPEVTKIKDGDFLVSDCFTSWGLPGINGYEGCLPTHFNFPAVCRSQ